MTVISPDSKNKYQHRQLDVSSGRTGIQNWAYRNGHTELGITELGIQNWASRTGHTELGIHCACRAGHTAVRSSLPWPQPAMTEVVQQGCHALIQQQALPPPGSLVSRCQQGHLRLHAACAICHDAVKLLKAPHPCLSCQSTFP